MEREEKCTQLVESTQSAEDIQLVESTQSAEDKCNLLVWSREPVEGLADKLSANMTPDELDTIYNKLVDMEKQVLGNILDCPCSKCLIRDMYAEQRVLDAIDYFYQKKLMVDMPVESSEDPNPESWWQECPTRKERTGKSTGRGGGKSGQRASKWKDKREKSGKEHGVKPRICPKDENRPPRNNDPRIKTLGRERERYRKNGW